jgi:hypothetical protein
MKKSTIEEELRKSLNGLENNMSSSRRMSRNGKGRINNAGEKTSTYKSM